MNGVKIGRVSINVDKTKVMHFHQKRCKITDHIFTIGGSSLELVNKYKYLGIVMSEHCDEAVTTTQLANAGSRSLAQLIMKTKSNYDLGYHSFTKLFTTTTAAIMDYAVGAWWTGTSCKEDGPSPRTGYKILLRASSKCQQLLVT